MGSGELGKTYHDGELIIRENETGSCMYVIQQGAVEVFQQRDGRTSRLAILGEGDFFGEMAIFENETRSASVRAHGTVRVITVDKKNFLKRIHEDPTLAYHIIQTMSKRLRQLDRLHTRIKVSDRRDWDSRPENPDKPQK